MTTSNGHKGDRPRPRPRIDFAAKAHETVDTIAERAQRAEREVRGAAANGRASAAAPGGRDREGRAEPAPRGLLHREQSARVRGHRVRGRRAAEHATAALTGARTMYELPELPYGYDALEPHVSRETLELHHDAHHAAYVKGANETLDKLEDARRSGEFEHIGQLEKSLAFNVSGHVLHSLLWKNLTPGERRRAGRRARGGAEAGLRQLRRVQRAAHGRGRERSRLRLGRVVVGAARQAVCSSSKCTTIKATRATPRCRSWSSTCGSTPTTCNTATKRRRGSKRSGSSSTGPTWRSASPRFARQTSVFEERVAYVQRAADSTPRKD